MNNNKPTLGTLGLFNNNKPTLKILFLEGADFEILIESDARKRNIDNIGVVLSKIHLDVPASKFAFRSRFSKSFTFSSFPFDFFISGYNSGHFFSITDTVQYCPKEGRKQC